MLSEGGGPTCLTCNKPRLLTGPRLPLAFYLKLFRDEISARERVFATTVMVISFALSVVGTVWAFLPKNLIGAK